MKHTPGPWKAFPEDNPPWVGCQSANDPSYYLTICEMDTENADDPSVNVADATLISAAPDLLAACEELVEAVQEVLESWESGDLAGAVNNLDGVACGADAAISKAKGGAS